jgi:hypothetical protein
MDAAKVHGVIPLAAASKLIIHDIQAIVLEQHPLHATRVAVAEVFCVEQNQRHQPQKGNQKGCPLTDHPCRFGKDILLVQEIADGIQHQHHT